ncbi:MAG: tail fiber domain-containing protein [Ferruginibacter sp.]
MKKYYLMMLLIGQLAFVTKINAQNIAINATGSMPDTSAMLDVSSTIKGFLAPRMNTKEQNAIPLPAIGLLVYNTDDNMFNVYTGTATKSAWTNLATGSGGTVSSFTAGSLSPLFSTGVANANSAPALTFTPSTAGGYTFLGRAGGTGAYSFISGMDSLWIPALHSQTYYDLRYNRLLVSGTNIKTVNNTSLLGSGNFSLEPVITAPNTSLKYWTGYKTYGSFYDSARAAITLTTTGTSGVATYTKATGVLNIPAYTPGTGTVTSVGLTSSDITVGGASPVTGSGTYTLALPTVNSNVGTYTNASITVNAKGLITAASSGSGGTGSSNGWALTGNTGSNPTKNYIGTSDGQPLVFKINGIQAGYLGMSGSSNATSFGVSSSASYQSTAIGSGALANTSNGATALGYAAIASGQGTIAIGSGANAANVNETIAIGYNSNSDSYQGIAIGSAATTSNTNNAIAIGYAASASGYQSAAIGSSSRATAQNSTAIGNGASASNANYISLGNTSVTAIRGQVNFTTYSDGRFKRNIHADVPGLGFILQLRPVTYNWDIHKFNEHSRGDDAKAMPVKYSAQNELEEAAILKKESITYTGFIAQEVEKAAKDCKFNFSGVLKPLNDKDAYSLSYAEFVVPLVKATQELNEKNEALNNKIDIQQKMIEQLIEEVKQLKKGHK